MTLFSSAPVKVGMMSFAHVHANSYAACLQKSANVEFAGIADADSTRGKVAAENYGVHYFDSYTELLNSDIEAVVICSENVFHCEMTQMAAEAGKHILCEKPLATNIKDCREMVNVCKENGVELYTAFPCRYVPEMARARNAIRMGVVGEIIAVSATNRGKCPGGWFVDCVLAGGGAVIDHTVHVVDLLRWCFDSEVVEVYAEIGNRMHHAGFDDTGLLSMRFENGIYATLDASWSRLKNFPTWGDVTMNVVGIDGTIKLDLFSKNLDYCGNGAVGMEWLYVGGDSDMGLIDSFCKQIRGEKTIIATGYDGLAAATVAFAAYESGRSGEPVKVEY